MVANILKGGDIIFISEKFMWNNIDSSELGLILITMDSDVLNEYGIAYSEGLEFESSYLDNPYYTKKSASVEPINLKLCLVDDNTMPLVWDNDLLEDIMNIFITDAFVPFASYDNLEDVYYLKVVEIKKVFNSSKLGYLDISFQPYSKYCYRKQVKTLTVNSETQINLVNYSNVDGLYSPIIELENLGDGITCNSIQNLSIEDSQPLLIENLNHKDKIIIDNLMYTVLDVEGRNRFDCQNRQWLRLKKGNNTLKFNGNCKISIKSEFPIIR